MKGMGWAFVKTSFTALLTLHPSLACQVQCHNAYWLLIMLFFPQGQNFSWKKFGSIRVVRNGKENLIYVNKAQILWLRWPIKSLYCSLHFIQFLQETLDFVHSFAFLSWNMNHNELSNKNFAVLQPAEGRSSFNNKTIIRIEWRLLKKLFVTDHRLCFMHHAAEFAIHQGSHLIQWWVITKSGDRIINLIS